jgi:hypothetical protein
VVRLSPRIDYRLIRALPQLDDGKQPVAETVRSVGQLADELGVTRPSYSRIRDYVMIERELRDLRRRRRERILVDAVRGRYHSDPRYYTELR